MLWWERTVFCHRLDWDREHHILGNRIQSMLLFISGLFKIRTGLIHIPLAIRWKQNKMHCAVQYTFKLNYIQNWRQLKTLYKFKFTRFRNECVDKTVLEDSIFKHTVGRIIKASLSWNRTWAKFCQLIASLFVFISFFFALKDLQTDLKFAFIMRSCKFNFKTAQNSKNFKTFL